MLWNGKFTQTLTVTVGNFDNDLQTPLVAISEALAALAGIRHATAVIKKYFRMFNFFWTVLSQCRCKLKRISRSKNVDVQVIEFGHCCRPTKNMGRGTSEHDP